MVEEVKGNQAAKVNQAATKIWKFCYILRGLPGSGKSTVARQLAGPTGVILNLDSKVNRTTSMPSAGSGEAGSEADTVVEIR